MSKNSQTKKARRKKRIATRSDRRLSDDVVNAFDTPALDEHAAELLSAAEKFDEFLVSRGWTFDEENVAEGLATWFYEPSATAGDDADPDAEPVTRVWFTFTGAEDDFPHAVHTILVGSNEDSGYYTLSPDLLVERIAELESYRAGDPEPLID